MIAARLQFSGGSSRICTPPGKFWILSTDFPGPRMSWIMSLVLKSPGN